jgi:acyl-CoA dehydrogenase
MAVNRENRYPYKIYTIFEGTSEIQRLVIARAVSGVHIQ